MQIPQNIDLLGNFSIQLQLELHSVTVYRFTQSSTMLSTGGISQQFSIPEHVEMSLFTAEFLRHAGEHLRILGWSIVMLSENQLE